MRGYDLGECLAAIDPAACSYAEWLEVGMALHAEGRPCSEWDAWSARDAARYHAGECAAKWETFDPSREGAVRGGTLVGMARERGWKPTARPDRPLGWGDQSVEDAHPTASGAPSAPGGELAAYLRALFRPGERVAFVTDSYADADGKLKPRGGFTADRDAVLSDLERYGGDVRKALADYDPAAGAWLCVNPVSGQGRGNADVADYRHALVESDEMPKTEQETAIRRLGLPVVAMVDSGGKSVHAVVRVDAPDLATYRRRVAELYEACRAGGFPVDAQNANPSRLTRMPGVSRGASEQRLLLADEGAPSWDEWRSGASGDGLPALDSLAEAFEDMPQLAPVLIDGVLRQGHKMLVSGSSKAGKSFLLIELCAALAAGARWLGHRCRQGPVLYVNLELDRASCLHRFLRVFDAMGVSRNYAGNVAVWNLRGRSVPLDRLAPLIVRRALAMPRRPVAIVVDPIYKVMTGDENSASDMGAFCNCFDMIAAETGASPIYCHHHSKGAQGMKAAMDRASGSGVFARDPDAMVDFSELVLPEDLAALRRGQSAWRASYVLREFATPAPTDVWFEYPVHAIDGSGELARLGVRGSDEAKRTEGGNATATKSRERGERINAAIAEAVAECASDGVAPTRAAVLERMDGEEVGEEVTASKLKRWTTPRKCEWAEWSTALGDKNEWIVVKIDSNR